MSITYKLTHFYWKDFIQTYVLHILFSPHDTWKNALWFSYDYYFLTIEHILNISSSSHGKETWWINLPNSFWHSFIKHYIIFSWPGQFRFIELLTILLLSQNISVYPLMFTPIIHNLYLSETVWSNAIRKEINALPNIVPFTIFWSLLYQFIGVLLIKCNISVWEQRVRTFLAWSVSTWDINLLQVPVILGPKKNEFFFCIWTKVPPLGLF